MLVVIEAFILWVAIASLAVAEEVWVHRHSHPSFYQLDAGFMTLRKSECARTCLKNTPIPNSMRVNPKSVPDCTLYVDPRFPAHVGKHAATVLTNFFHKPA